MAKKERVSLNRSEEFESVDDVLTAAMLRLDSSNQRVETLLLQSKDLPGLHDSADAAPAADAPAPADGNA
jgi:hypothetical protein